MQYELIVENGDLNILSFCKSFIMDNKNCIEILVDILLYLCNLNLLEIMPCWLVLELQIWRRSSIASMSHTASTLRTEVAGTYVSYLRS